MDLTGSKEIKEEEFENGRGKSDTISPGKKKKKKKKGKEDDEEEEDDDDERDANYANNVPPVGIIELVRPNNNFQADITRN